MSLGKYICNMLQEKKRKQQQQQQQPTIQTYSQNRLTTSHLTIGESSESS